MTLTPHNASDTCSQEASFTHRNEDLTQGQQMSIHAMVAKVLIPDREEEEESRLVVPSHNLLPDPATYAEQSPHLQPSPSLTLLPALTPPSDEIPPPSPYALASPFGASKASTFPPLAQGVNLFNMFFFNKETIFEETSEISAGHYKAVEAWEAHGGNAAAAAAEGLNLVENDAVAGKGIVYMERICFRARALLEAMHQLKPCKLTCFGKMEPGFTEAFELLIGDVKTFGRALRAGRNTEHYVLKGIDVAGEVSMARKTYGTVLEALLELADGREARIGLTAFASKPEAKHKHVVRTVLGLLPQLQEALQTVLVPMERIKVMEGWPPAWCTVVAGGTSEAWHINSRFNGCLIAWTGRSSEKKAKKYMTRS